MCRELLTGNKWDESEVLVEVEMLSERSTAVLKSLPDTNVYPVVMVFLLLGTTLALTMGRNWFGVTGFLLLALMSLAYGAVQTGEEMP